MGPRCVLGHPDALHSTLLISHPLNAAFAFPLPHPATFPLVLSTSLNGRSLPAMWIAASPAYLFHCCFISPTATATERQLCHICIGILSKTQISVGWNCFAFEPGPFWAFLLCAPSSTVNAAVSRAPLGLLTKKSHK